MQPLKGSNWDAYAIYMLGTKSSKERTNWQSLVSALKSSKVEETAQISYFQGTEGIHSWIIILTIHRPIHNRITQYNCCTILDLVEDLDPWGYDWPKLLFWDFFVQIDDQFWTKFATHTDPTSTISSHIPIVCMPYMHKAALRWNTSLSYVHNFILPIQLTMLFRRRR